VEPLPPASRRSTRLALVAGGLVLLLAVVAFASRSGFGRSSHAAPSNTYTSYAFTVFLILFVLMIPVTIYGWIVRVRESDPRDRPSALRRFVRSIVTVVIFALAAYVIYIVRAHFHLVRHPASGTVPPPGTKHGHGRAGLQHAATQTGPAFEWTVLWVAVALGVVGTVALVVLYRRQRANAPALELPSVTEDVAATIGDAIDDLERESDPRRAVIAAYARMEGVLGRHGFRRRPSETAVEYMRRVLLSLTERGDAVERLTDLFEQAKFSTHEIDTTMKADAIAALREIRDELTAS
jgi:Domain of unknown function (DUF4129)